MSPNNSHECRWNSCPNQLESFLVSPRLVVETHVLFFSLFGFGVEHIACHHVCVCVCVCVCGFTKMYTFAKKHTFLGLISCKIACKSNQKSNKIRAISISICSTSQGLRIKPDWFEKLCEMKILQPAEIHKKSSQAARLNCGKNHNIKSAIAVLRFLLGAIVGHTTKIHQVCEEETLSPTEERTFYWTFSWTSHLRGGFVKRFVAIARGFFGWLALLVRAFCTLQSRQWCVSVLVLFSICCFFGH